MRISCLGNLVWLPVRYVTSVVIIWIRPVHTRVIYACQKRRWTENIWAVVEMKMEGSVLEEDRSWGEKILSWGTWKPGTSGRNGPLTRKDGNVYARPATPHRETAAKSEKGENTGDLFSIDLLWYRSLWLAVLSISGSFVTGDTVPILTATVFTWQRQSRSWASTMK